MEKVNLTIHVVPKDIPLSDLKGVRAESIGSYLSTTTNVRVTKIDTGYSILYTDDVFSQLDPERAINYIVQLFMSRLPDKVIRVTLDYHFECRDGMDLFDDNVGSILSDMEDVLIEIDNNTPALEYYRSETMDDVIDILEEDTDDDSDEDDDPYDEDEEYDLDDIGGLINFITHDGDRSRTKNKKKKSKRHYSESEVLHETKNAKRCYNRHGVMVCSDKDALKHDQKMIKEFLKDFIPGSAEWKKDFRRDLQKRWMQMYVISKKQLKHLQKKHVKSKNKKRRGLDADKVIDFTRRAFNVSNNSSAWNDPNR